MFAFKGNKNYKYLNLLLFNRLLSSNKCLITTPIFYVNSKPHIGHIYTCLLADVLARYYRLNSNSVLFLTGTDEHGLKIQQSALKNNKSCIEFCNEISKEFRDSFNNMNISYDKFMRTTTTEHKKGVHHIWNKLYENDYIYLGKHEGWYCISDECFVLENQIHSIWPEHLKNDPKYNNQDPKDHPDAIKVMKDTGQQVIWVAETNYMFRLSKLENKLLKWLETNPNCIIPKFKYDEVVHNVRQGLKDVSISRLKKHVEWGIEVPNDDTQCIYVWFDALINYLVGCNYPDEAFNNPDNSYWPANYQIIGKDILRFHTILWPAILIAAELRLPNKIIAHGHWMVNHRKMSKSLGNVISPVELMETYGTDAVRYFLLSGCKIDQDNSFDLNELILRYNSFLPDTLGNLLQRCCNKRFLDNNTITLDNVQKQNNLFFEWITSNTSYDNFQNILETLTDDIKDDYENIDPSTIMFRVANILHMTNGIVSASKPWILARSDDHNDYELMQTIIYYSLDVARICAIILIPILPNSMSTLLKCLNISKKDQNLNACRLGYHKIFNITLKKKKQQPLFTKLTLNDNT